MRVRKMNTIINNYAKYEKKIFLEDNELKPSNL